MDAVCGFVNDGAVKRPVLVEIGPNSSETMPETWKILESTRSYEVL